jgi:hypothetical protein
MLIVGKGFAQMKTFRLGIMNNLTCLQNTFDSGRSWNKANDIWKRIMLMH